MVQAWVMDPSCKADQREEHKTNPVQEVSLAELAKSVGVLYWRVPVDELSGVAEGNPTSPQLEKIRKERGYINHDVIAVSKEKLPNYEDKLKVFFDEHLHTDEEIRYVLDGSGYFDVRDKDERWIRIKMEKGDMITLPAGIFHRFTLDTKNWIKAMRLFKEEPKWTAYSRKEGAKDMPIRAEYLKSIGSSGPPPPAAAAAASSSSSSSSSGNGEEKKNGHVQPMERDDGDGDDDNNNDNDDDDGPNGKAYVMGSDSAKSIANYPHMRELDGRLYVSGISSRRPDNTHVGAVKQADGTFKLDIRAQTEQVIKNIGKILGRAGADLSHVVDITVFLVDMADYKGMNEIYNKYFDARRGPTRTTVAVHQLPHKNLLVEMKAVAAKPTHKRRKIAK